MKNNVLLMSLVAFIVFSCNEIEEVPEIENPVQSIDKGFSNYSEDEIYFTQEYFTLEVEKLLNSYAGKSSYANKTLGECLDTNTNTDYDITIPKVGEQINFVYSSHYEPDLVYNHGPKQNGESMIFHAVKRGLNTVENAIKELNKTNGQEKQHELFTVEFTDAPLYDDHSNMQSFHGLGWIDYNNYSSRDFSYDGINSIAWVDFRGNGGSNPDFVRGNFHGNVFTVWDRNGYIIERDIILQNTELLSWAIKSDLTSKKGGTVDCSLEADIQSVITHFALQTVGLRPLHSGIKIPGEGDDATIFKPTGWRNGPYIMSELNHPFGWHPHSWQTLTPGDKQGAWEAAPEKGLVIEPDIPPVPDADQLILHYDFDDDLATSATVSDQSGNGLDGIIVGALSTEAGMNNSAARFDNNSYIDLDGKNFPGEKLPLTGYTMGVWLKADFSTYTQQAIFGAMSHMDSELWSRFSQSGCLNFIGSSLMDPFVWEFVNTPVPNDEWFHYAVTFDTVSREYALYIDGVAVSEDIAPIPSSLPSFPAGTNLIENWDKFAYVAFLDHPFFGQYYFEGLMDDFALYNYALSASEIDNLKNGGPSAVPVP